MVAFNFTLFTDLVTDGVKRQTIRATGKMGLRASPGATLQLYTGQRTKKCHKLRPDVICSSTSELIVSPEGHVWHGLDYPGLIPRISELALLDGFGTLDAFNEYFPPGFRGYVYRWEVRYTSLSIRQWWYVWRDPVLDSLFFDVPSGRRYWVRFANAGYLPGAVGLMRGIPADWRLT